ncbi:hypothetical protein BCF33_0026 [Hasllibacter halocynthiae]|uniref:DUF1178 family protein n=1 Tax=Hasllibacter halocynthiae TaxID=595589 RepID=A0A2T0X675_9RHOB|nr:DUF1178 family protein [Hasllibacter halocynthiae]PRY94439.1 hypothetical protein BCF33_0026 [Hasllibacter halocynthiae]
MIRYTLRCAEGHVFESWFQDAAAYDRLALSGALACATCGGGGVEKSLMAPKVRPARKAAEAPVETSVGAKAPAKPMGAGMPDKLVRAMAELRAHVEAGTDDVGKDFARQARAMHEGEIEDRPIRGEATADEARSLLEDGVPALPLPFPSRKKMT